MNIYGSATLSFRLEIILDSRDYNFIGYKISLHYYTLFMQNNKLLHIEYVFLRKTKLKWDNNFFSFLFFPLIGMHAFILFVLNIVSFFK